MESSSAGEGATKHEGGRDLTMKSSDDTLPLASVHKLTSVSHNITAGMVFDEEGEEEEEEDDNNARANTCKPTGSDINEFTREKPLFSSSVTHPGDCVSLKLCDTAEDKVPYTINRYLRDYQREGIRFIYNNYIHARGCILGDDMGLGKTVQVIGFLAAVLHKTGTWEDIQNNKPQFLQSQAPSVRSKPNIVFLIIAPLSVLYNWKEELDTWGHFQCVVVHGLRKEEELARVKKGRAEIALTTYETLRLSLDQFNSIDWSAVFVDEAHKIKNPNSQITQAMKDLRCQIRVGLTGTVLQNNLEELWCVMDWAIPGCLGSLGHFRSQFSDPIEQGQRHSATKRALATGRKRVQALVRKISPWFLRRTKALIKDQLPKKDDRVVFCRLTDFQQTVYQTVLDTEDVTLLLRSAEKCDCRSGRTRRNCCYKTNSDGTQVKFLYFSYLAILRKVANHVALLQATAGTSEKQEKYVSAICREVFQKLPDFVQRCKDEAFEALSDPMYSGKMQVLQKLLRYYLKKRDKVLLFSLSTKLLDVLESFCMAEGLDYSRLDGTTRSKDRVQIVQEFNSSTHINLCLVSTMAGGLGLNITGANIVVLFDPTWNPANDLQAVDRAYRIGQCRDVTVLRLISLGTVEEVIYLRQVYKQQLQSSVVGKETARRYFEAVQGVHEGELFGTRNLFRLQTQGTCLTRKILEREGRVEAGVVTTGAHDGGGGGEEGTTGAGEPRGLPLTGALTTNTDAGKTSSRVLDFSSGSEEDEKEQGVDRTSTESTSSGNAGPTSLHHRGFSALLQRVKATAESEDDWRSSDEGSSYDEDTKGTSRQMHPDGGGESGSRPTDNGGRRGAGGDDEGRKELVRKAWTPKKKMAGVEIEVTSSSDEEEWTTLAPPAPRFDGYSDESDDLDMETVCRPMEPRYTDDIETFTSSEDEHATPQTQRSKSASRAAQTVGAGGSRGQRSPAAKGTIDSVLGGVQEVVYAHSNQRIVGGSRAEELISRAAMRDVFEHKMYSQLPANWLDAAPQRSPPRSPPRVTGSQLSVDHPVTFTDKSVRHTAHGTVILGDTPRALRRQQLEEMASAFNFPSAHQFAAEVLRSSSTRRLAWLRQYYASRGRPELSAAVTAVFSQPEVAQTSSAVVDSTNAVPPAAAAKSRREPRGKDVARSRRRQSNHRMYPECQTELGSPLNDVSVPRKRQKNTAKYVPDPQEKQTNPQKNVLKPPRDVPSPESEEETVASARRHQRTRRGSVSRAGGGLGADRATVSPARGETHCGHDPSTPLSKPTTEAAEVQTPSGQTPGSSLADLLGDTSILDDLLRPRSRGRRSPPQTPSTSSPGSVSAGRSEPGSSETPHTAPRGSRKDFWDILDEGNEESINRLTDLTEVQRVCVRAKVAARTQFVETESKSLWKTNEKFLWRK